jgi:hypothetical protein|tara:strand:- start:665 stop:1048 length:384 start_codon:yes stop_codon:yes gene_type:complete
MNTDTYKILKLISGENIICELSEDNGKYEISRPLLMNIQSRVNHTGMTESLMLSRWVQPFTEQRHFELDPKHVIIILPASPGLSVYYEGILNKLDNIDDEPFVDDFEDEEIYEELLDELETESKYIH